MYRMSAASQVSHPRGQGLYTPIKMTSNGKGVTFFAHSLVYASGAIGPVEPVALLVTCGRMIPAVSISLQMAGKSITATNEQRSSNSFLSR